MKIGVLRSEPLELLAIVDVLLVTHAEQQPEFASFMPGWIRQQPVKHRAKGSDPGSSRNKDRVPQGRTENEASERSLKSNFTTLGQIAEVVRHEPVRHAIQTEGKADIIRGWRCNRIRARDFLTVRLRSCKRKPLTGNKAEAGNALRLKFQMPGKFRKRRRANQRGP